LLGSTHLPHPVFSINRGGQATYQRAGPIDGYPIIDLRRCGQDLHKYLRWLEQLLIDLSPDMTLPRSDANRSREFGSKIARSLQSASVFAIGYHARVRVERVRRSLAFDHIVSVRNQ